MFTYGDQKQAYEALSTRIARERTVYKHQLMQKMR